MGEVKTYNRLMRKRDGASSPLPLCAFLLLSLVGCTSLSGQSDLLNLSHLDEGIVDVSGQETENIYDPLNLLQQGEAYSGKGDHVAAVAAYQRFLELYPFHRLASFTQYALGLSYMRQITSVDRDTTPIEQAKQAFEKILTNHPDSLYAPEAAKNIMALAQQLAEYQFLIGRYYYKQAVYPAAIARFESVLGKIGHSELTEKTLYYLGQSYQNSGNSEAAQQIFQRLKTEYPDSIR